MSKKLSDNISMVLERIRYLFTAKYRNGHGVHSPAVYELVSMVLFSRQKSSDYKKIEELVYNLKKDASELKFVEMGGGSRKIKDGIRTVKQIALNSSVKPKYVRFLYRLVHYYKPKVILELGTSLGISSFYMAMGCTSSIIHTIEGNNSVLGKAKENADTLGIKNILFHHGNFNEALPALLSKIELPSIAFIDGNHTYEATINYYNQLSKIMTNGIIVLDDIYWSAGMIKAWAEIKSRETVTVDIFQFGVIILGEMLTPGHYRIRF